MTSAAQVKNLQLFAQQDMLDMKPTFEDSKTDNGSNSLVVKNIAIFRSGSFKDSWGDTHTYSKFEMDSFARNFSHLSDNSIFDPVVRAGHPGMTNDRLASVIGYIRNIEVENRQSLQGVSYDYLIAELEIIDKDAIEKIKSGLWNKRSAEIGAFEDNDNNIYAPAVLGVAYVDVPAVQWLDWSKNHDTDNIQLFDKEGLEEMTGMPKVHVFHIGGNDTSEFSRVQDYITNIEAKFAAASGEISTLKTENESLKTTNDALAEFKKEALSTARHSYIDSLAASGKILETGKTEAYAMVDMFTEEQFTAYKKVMGDAAPNPIFGAYGNQEQDENKVPDEKADEISVYKSVIQDLRGVGRSIDSIKKTQAYAKVIAVEPNYVIQ